MAFIVGGNAVVLDNGTLNVAQYATRSLLNQAYGIQAYIAFVTDQAEYVVNYGTSVTTGSEYGVYWYKFLVKPMDYKNEVILAQGTVGAGYQGSNIWNIVSRVIYSNDIITIDAPTLPFTNKYGGHHATYLYAYYHQGQGNTSSASAYQDWATGTIVSNNAIPAAQGSSPNSTQPGPKTQNTFGILLQGTVGQTLNFSTNTWSTANGLSSYSQGFGDGSFGQNYSYTYTYSGGVYQFNNSNLTWSQATASNHINGVGTYGKTLTSKWNKFYYMGDNSSSTYTTVSGFNMGTNSWYNTNSNIGTWSEGAGLMGQDWGYMVGGYNVATGQQGSYSTKTFYATDTNLQSSLTTSSQTGLSSGAGAWGPIP